MIPSHEEENVANFVVEKQVRKVCVDDFQVRRPLGRK